MATSRRTPRVPLEQRREQILVAALHEFSHKGLHGGSTVSIAAEIGVSQPNIFRIFSTKHALFIAVLERVLTTIEATMLAAGERSPDQPLHTMSDAWGSLMEERLNMFMLLQGYAASDDPVVRDLMHNWTRSMFERIEALPGAGEDSAHGFIAEGMLYMVATAMDLPAKTAGDPWANRFLASGT